jgi:hypothetical protein
VHRRGGQGRSDVYKTTRRTVRFDLDKPKDLAEYDAVMNDPNCTILDRIKEKIQDKEFEDGKLVSLHERIIFIITYEERKLL